MELMVVVAIIGVVASLAYPSYRDSMALNRVQSMTSKLVSSLALARSEAVKSNLSSVVCKSANGLTCTTTGFWEQGWITYRDADASNTFNPGVANPNEILLHVSGPIQDDITIRAGNSYTNFLNYRSDGTTGFLLSNTDNQSFKVCMKLDKTFSRQIFIDASGRPRVETAGVASCTTP